MSTYNTDMICTECKVAETKRPDFAKAKKAEEEAVRRGDRDFGGIGFADDEDDEDGGGLRCLPSYPLPFLVE